MSSTSCAKEDHSHGNTTHTNNDTVREVQNWSGLSFVLQLFLPMAGLALIWKRKDIFTKLWVHLDKNCVSVFCPSFSQRDQMLKWTQRRLPSTWSSPHCRTLSAGLSELWFDGSLLCTLINTAIPGACPNPHRHWKKPPTHAQALAYKYLGVLPVFPDNDLGDIFTSTRERYLLYYLTQIHQAIGKIESGIIVKYPTHAFIARGMGLFDAEQHREATFYIYQNTEALKQKGDVMIHIRGPYSTHGEALVAFHKPVIPEIRTPDTKSISSSRKNKQNDFLEQLFVRFKDRMNRKKKQTGERIVITVEDEPTRAKITYLPNNFGMYEINLISNGELLIGCPFSINVAKANLPNAEYPVKHYVTGRKVISKTIDFIDHQEAVSNIEADIKRKTKKVPDFISSCSFRKAVDEVTRNALIVNNNEKLQIEACDNISEVESNSNKIKRDMAKNAFRNKSDKIVEEPEEEHESTIKIHNQNTINEADGEKKLSTDLNSEVPSSNDKKRIQSEKNELNNYEISTPYAEETDDNKLKVKEGKQKNTIPELSVSEIAKPSFGGTDAGKSKIDNILNSNVSLHPNIQEENIVKINRNLSNELYDVKLGKNYSQEIGFNLPVRLAGAQEDKESEEISVLKNINLHVKNNNVHTNYYKSSNAGLGEEIKNKIPKLDVESNKKNQSAGIINSNIPKLPPEEALTFAKIDKANPDEKTTFTQNIRFFQNIENRKVQQPESSIEVSNKNNNLDIISQKLDNISYETKNKKPNFINRFEITPDETLTLTPKTIFSQSNFHQDIDTEKDIKADKDNVEIKVKDINNKTNNLDTTSYNPSNKTKNKTHDLLKQTGVTQEECFITANNKKYDENERTGFSKSKHFYQNHKNRKSGKPGTVNLEEKLKEANNRDNIVGIINRKFENLKAETVTLEKLDNNRDNNADMNDYQTKHKIQSFVNRTELIPEKTLTSPIEKKDNTDPKTSVAENQRFTQIIANREDEKPGIANLEAKIKLVNNKNNNVNITSNKLNNTGEPTKTKTHSLINRRQLAPYEALTSSNNKKYITNTKAVFGQNQPLSQDIENQKDQKAETAHLELKGMNNKNYNLEITNHKLDNTSEETGYEPISPIKQSEITPEKHLILTNNKKDDTDIKTSFSKNKLLYQEIENNKSQKLETGNDKVKEREDSNNNKRINVCEEIKNKPHNIIKSTQIQDQEYVLTKNKNDNTGEAKAIFLKNKQFYEDNEIKKSLTSVTGNIALKYRHVDRRNRYLNDIININEYSDCAGTLKRAENVPSIASQINPLNTAKNTEQFGSAEKVTHQALTANKINNTKRSNVSNTLESNEQEGNPEEVKKDETFALAKQAYKTSPTLNNNAVNGDKNRYKYNNLYQTNNNDKVKNILNNEMNNKNLKTLLPKSAIFISKEVREHLTKNLNKHVALNSRDLEILPNALKTPSWNIDDRNTIIKDTTPIPSRFFNLEEATTEKPSSSPTNSSCSCSLNSASPICFDHIVPEDEIDFGQLSVSERRKVFSHKPSAKTSSQSIDSSYTEIDSLQRSEKKSSGLRLLGVMKTLKTIDSYQSTVSLPDMPLDEDNMYIGFVKSKKDYWEKVSSTRTSSSLSNPSLTFSDESPRKINRQFVHDQVNHIWKKSSDGMDTKTRFHKSEADISSIFESSLVLRSCQSLDTSLDECTVLSIEDRKRLLLKQNYERENLRRSPKNIKKLSFKDRPVKKCWSIVDINAQNARVLPSVQEKLAAFTADSTNGDLKSSDEVFSSKSINQGEIKQRTHYIHNNLNEAPVGKSLKHRFRSALKFFKKLEDKSPLDPLEDKPVAQIKVKSYESVNIPIIKARLMRDRNSNYKLVSDKFCVDNVFEDVVGSRRGSFKGTPNRSALVNALATFSRRSSAPVPADDNIEIEYNFFKTFKRKKDRRSLKSVFDVIY